ncbi:MAG TPA: SigB/SigF/SigG family RNA polymerase sigma factor [Solirubrobacterales bacterium]|jgi:RNA polymerase sigma-B factor|nr:SigB/SigF/SigG family RNA polymerase sigma factor [Solirubrobacterales bacterium]
MSATARTPSTVRRERELWRRYARDRGQDARAELLELYLPMARRMASRYAGISEPYDDLMQVASLGLLNAIDRFDPARGIPFRGYAKPTIIGELKRHFRDKVWTVRVPRSIHDLMARIEKVGEELTLELGRPPSVAELAAELAIEPSEVLEALEVRRNRRPLSLDAPPPGDEEDSVPEWLGDLDSAYELVEDRLTMESVLPTLDDREREVLHLRFVDDLPQSKIAARIGCSQMHVSRQLRRSLARLREEAEGRAGDPSTA